MRAAALPVPHLAVAVAALLLATGCSRNADAPDTPAAVETSGSASPQTSSSAPDVTATPATPSDSVTPLPLLDRLLPTAEVPGLNAQWHWQDGDTGRPPTDPFGVCAKADLLSIGASDVAARSYFPPDDSDDAAAEQVAEFPDAKTAATAWTVLKAWHDRCGRTLGASTVPKIGPLQVVPVSTGTGRWYLVSWNPPGEETARFEALGMVMAGTRIAVLTMDHSGPDHTYPAGKDPMAAMVVAAAGRMR